MRLVGQVRITLPPEVTIVSCGGVTGREMVNSVPLPQLPPYCVVPYKVFCDKTNPAAGLAPSLLVS